MATTRAAPIVILARHPDGRVETFPAARIDEVDELRARPDLLVWVTAERPSEPMVDELAREFDLHPLAVEDLRKRRQRPKVDTYGTQHMLVAYEAVPDAPSGMSEVHLFVGPGCVLSVTWAATPSMDAVRERFAGARNGTPTTVGGLLYAVLDAVVDSYFPELDRISDRIDVLEDHVLEGSADRESLAEILGLKRRLLDLRRIVAPTRDVVNALLRRDIEVIETADLPYYQDLYDHLVRVLDQLDVYRDLLATVLEARLTVASNSLNAIMKRLTAFTVVLMVPTLIAGIYGMNFDRMPELSWPLGYPLALGLMVLAAGGAVVWFRRKGWF